MSDAVVAAVLGLHEDDLRVVIKVCDCPLASLSDKGLRRSLDPKSFWRIDKAKDPELRPPRHHSRRLSRSAEADRLGWRRPRPGHRRLPRPEQRRWLDATPHPASRRLRPRPRRPRQGTPNPSPPASAPACSTGNSPRLPRGFLGRNANATPRRSSAKTGVATCSEIPQSPQQLRRLHLLRRSPTRKSASGACSPSNMP